MRNAAQRYLELKEKSGATQAGASPLTPDRDLKIAPSVENPHGSNSLERAGQTVVDVVKAALHQDTPSEGGLPKEYAILLRVVGRAARFDVDLMEWG